MRLLNSVDGTSIINGLALGSAIFLGGIFVRSLLKNWIQSLSDKHKKIIYKRTWRLFLALGIPLYVLTYAFGFLICTISLMFFASLKFVDGIIAATSSVGVFHIITRVFPRIIQAYEKWR